MDTAELDTDRAGTALLDTARAGSDSDLGSGSDSDSPEFAAPVAQPAETALADQHTDLGHMAAAPALIRYHSFAVPLRPASLLNSKCSLGKALR